MLADKNATETKTNPDGGQDPSAKGEQAKQDGDGTQKTVPLAALQEEREKRQQRDQELEQLKSTVQQLQQSQLQQGSPFGGQPQGQQMPQQQSVAPQQQPPMNPQAQQRARLQELWDTNPQQAAQLQMQQTVQWMDKVNTSVNQQVSQLGEKFDDFGQYERAVRNYINQVPINQRAQQGIAELAYYVVKGQQSGTQAQQTAQQNLQRTQAGVAAGGMPSAGGGGGQPSGDEGLSEQEKIAAKAMGISEEDYLNSKRRK